MLEVHIIYFTKVLGRFLINSILISTIDNDIQIDYQVQQRN